MLCYNFIFTRVITQLDITVDYENVIQDNYKGVNENYYKTKEILNIN